MKKLSKSQRRRKRNINKLHRVNRAKNEARIESGLAGGVVPREILGRGNFCLPSESESERPDSKREEEKTS